MTMTEAGMWMQQREGAWDSLSHNQPIARLDAAEAEPFEVLQSWTREQLAEQLGVYWSPEAEPAPADHFWTGGWHIELSGLVATMVREYRTPELTVTKTSRSSQVNATRDALIEGGYWYLGHRIQSRASDRENIASVGSDAAMALMSGKRPGDLKWANFPDGRDFGWIVENNAVVPMDAVQTRGMYTTGAQLKQAWTFYARSLKDRIEAAASLEELNRIDIVNGWPPAGEEPTRA